VLSPLTDLSTLDGLTFNISDDVSCLVVGNECIADNGDIYVLRNGDLVKQGDSSGSLGILSFMLLFLSGLLTLWPKRLITKEQNINR